MTRREAYKTATTRLREMNFETPEIEARFLLCEVLDTTAALLFSDMDAVMSAEDLGEYETLIGQRLTFKPLAYVIGRKEFYALEFLVNEHTLIPRDDTTILVDRAIVAIRERGYRKVFEPCTGSGCVAIALAYNCRNIEVYATDIDERALAIAETSNASPHGVADRITFAHEDILTRLPNERFDLIVSNPPYIPTDDIEALMPDVKNYEPHTALDGGVDGLKFYRRIAEVGHDVLNENGMIIVEIGYNQDKDVCAIFESVGFKTALFLDLAGLPRVIEASLKD